MRPKIIRVALVTMVLLLQTIFLAMMLKEKIAMAQTNTWNMALAVFIISILIIIFIVNVKFEFHHEEHLYDDILVAIWVPAAALMCFFLITYLKIDRIIAASSIGLLASLIPVLNKKSGFLKHLPITFYCGSFVGMTSTNNAASWHFVLVAGSITGLLLIISKSIFQGIGGKLGTIAFGGVIAASIVYFIIK